MAANDPSETFLTVAEVAETLKLNQQTVRNWIDQGSLQAVRVGRRVRIRQSEFERLLRDASRPAAGSAGQASGPSAEDFWGGTPVGIVDASSEEAGASAEETAQADSEDGRP